MFILLLKFLVISSLQHLSPDLTEMVGKKNEISSFIIHIIFKAQN